MRPRGSVRRVIPTSGEDLPVFDEAPLASVEFAPRALRTPGRRGRVAAAGWAVAIAALVGVGVLATEAEVEPSRIAEAVPSAPARLDSRLPSTRMGALLTLDVIELTSPAPTRAEITTARLDVAGAVLVRAARVRVALEARGNRVLDDVSVDTADPHGGIRPEYGPTFSASFELPRPRPNGTIWVVVTAYDETGMPVGTMRRPIVVGPLISAAESRQRGTSLDGKWPRRPSGGVDPRAPLPTCMPVSTTLASSC